MHILSWATGQATGGDRVGLGCVFCHQWIHSPLSFRWIAAGNIKGDGSGDGQPILQTPSISSVSPPSGEFPSNCSATWSGHPLESRSLASSPGRSPGPGLGRGSAAGHPAWDGFRIGLLPQAAIRSMPKHLPSAQAHRDIIGAYLEQQVQAGHMLGPFHPKDCQGGS